MRRKYTRIPVARPPSVFRDASPLWVPYLFVRLGANRHETPKFRALVDSGSPYCIFHATLGELIGIEIEKGVPDRIYGVGAGLGDPVFFHKVQLFVDQEWVIETTVGFVKGLAIGGILGRAGFFDNFRVCFDHSEFPPAFELTRIERPH